MEDNGRLVNNSETAATGNKCLSTETILSSISNEAPAQHDVACLPEHARMLANATKDAPSCYYGGDFVKVLPTSSDMLDQVAQQLIADINVKRKRDTSLLLDWKKSLEMQASKSFEALEQAMYSVYNQNSSAIQEKLEDLFATLDRIRHLEQELLDFKQALGLFYQDLQQE